MNKFMFSAALLLLSLLILQPIFAPGFLVKSDSPVHVAEASYLARILKTHFWINGWYPYELAGFPLQMYYYQLGMLLVASLTLLGIPVIFAYKMALVLALFLPALAIFFLLKKYFSSWISFAIAAAFLFQKDLPRLMLAGMWANLIAFALFILFLKKLLDYRCLITKKRALLLGLLAALIILAHPFFGIALAYTLLLAFFFSAQATHQPGKTFLHYTLLAIIAFLTTLFYLYPFFDTASWLNPGSGWGLGDSLGEMLFNLVGIFFSLKPHLAAFNHLLAFNPEFFFEFFKSIIANLPLLLINLLALLGFWQYRKETQKEAKRFLTFILLFMLLSLLIGSGFWFLFEFGKSTPFLNGILAYRFVYYARLGLFVFAAYALHRYSNNASGILAHKKIIISILLVLIAAGFLLQLHTPSPGYTQTFSQAGIQQETLELWKELSTLPKDQFRILNENFFDNIEEPLITKDSILPAMAHEYTDQHFFGAWYTTVYPMEKKSPTENHQLFGKPLSTITDEEIQQYLTAYNLKYLIAISPELKARFNNLSFLTPKKQFPHYTLYEFQSYQPSWVQSAQPIEATLQEFSDQRIIFQIKNPSPENPTIIKFSYHPYWKAFVNGKEINLRSNSYYLMEADLPEGEYPLMLQYQPKNYPAIIISILTLVMALAILWSKKK